MEMEITEKFLKKSWSGADNFMDKEKGDVIQLVQVEAKEIGKIIYE